MCCDETAEYSVCDGWPNGDVGGWRLARSSRRGTLELGTEDPDAQKRQACTAPMNNTILRSFQKLSLLSTALTTIIGHCSQMWRRRTQDFAMEEVHVVAAGPGSLWTKSPGS